MASTSTPIQDRCRMLCFLPPIPGARRPEEPPPPRRTAFGVVAAVLLMVAGMVLPHLRPTAHPADRPRAASGSSPD